MTAFWDSSAVVKLYADEAGAPEARRWSGPIVVSALAVTEVLAAVWGKVARHELDEEPAGVLDRAFVSDLRRGRFAVLPLTDAVVDRSVECVRRHRLRGADALQLAAAMTAGAADPAIDTIAAFDGHLRRAAGAEGFALLP